MSTKISKSLVQKVARDLCQSTIGIEIKTVEGQIKEIADIAIWSQIPENVKTFYELHPSYCKVASDCTFVFGKDELRVECSKHPAVYTWCPVYEVEHETFHAINVLMNLIEDLESKKRKAERDIEAALLSLSTFKKIKANFKEAYKFIPIEFTQNNETSIAVPIEALRKTLGL